MILHFRLGRFFFAPYASRKITQFSILATARSSFHLSVLEAIYFNSLNPIFCRQTELVYSLQISQFFFEQILEYNEAIFFDQLNCQNDKF